MLIKGMSKHTHIVTSTPDLSFGNVAVGKVVEKEFTIRNISLVPTSFSIRRAFSDIESCFTLSKLNGKLAAQSEIAIKVTYTPITSGMYSRDSFEIHTPGGNTTTIKCFGTAIGPSVEFSTNFIDFGTIQEGETVSKVLTIYNQSNDVAHLQFHSDVGKYTIYFNLDQRFSSFYF
jgi:hypothetical protein